MKSPRHFFTSWSTSGRSRVKFLLPVLLLLAALLFPLPRLAQSQVLEINAATLFLPFKIIAPAGSEELAERADAELARLAQAKGAAMLSRTQTAARLDYDAWPPDPALLSRLALHPAVRSVVAGSLTRFGETVSLDVTVFDLLGQQPPRHFSQPGGSPAQLAPGLERLVAGVLAYTEPEQLVTAVLIEGNQKTDSGAILRRVTTKAGDRFDPEKLRTDLKSIFALGSFDDVRIKAEKSEQGRQITFVVTEKPIIGQVNLTGVKKLKETEVREVIAVIPNTILNTVTVQGAADSIVQLYKDKGYYNTTVTPHYDETGTDRVNVRFEIEEGVRVYIREIRLVGNTAFEPKEIKKVMATSEKNWLSWFTEAGRLKRDILDQDRARIAAFYHNHGFIDAKVGEPEVTQEDESLFITFNIQEGERYRVGTIDLAGDLIADKNELLKEVKLGREKYFNRQVLREDVIRLTDRYAADGYAFAEIDPLIERNDALKRVDVILQAAKHHLVYVNRITIRGNTRTRDKVLRREMQVKEGEILDTTALRRSTERLQRLDYFEEVNITPTPTLEDDLMDVTVEVKEKPTGTFSLGMGYSSMDSLMFMGQISQENLFGKGQKLAFQADISGSSSMYNLGFTEPHLDDSQLSFGFDLYNWTREYTDYTKESSGGALRFGYPLWEKWRAYWGYGYESTSLSDLKANPSIYISQSMEIKITSYIRLGMSRDTRNNRLDPTRGSLHDINLKHAGLFLGGDSSFTRFEGSTTWFFPWSDVPLLKEAGNPWLNDTTWRLKGAAGYAIENETNKLPIYEKFYLGGLRTLRGFENGVISPRDPVTNERIGGEKMWYMNSEWIFPVVKDIGLKGLLFFDAGNVYRKSEGFDLGNIKKSVGLGFRWLSPMGPLRLEWGYNLEPAPDEDRSVWDFSMGGMF